MNYLTGAALLARKAHALEASHRLADWPGQAALAEHHTFASTAIMMSAAAVETLVNEPFAECRDQPERNRLRLPRDKAALVAGGQTLCRASRRLVFGFPYRASHFRLLPIIDVPLFRARCCY
nr:hypothetical protein [Burkholderia ambifaria]